MKHRHTSSSSSGALATEAAATEPVTAAGAGRHSCVHHNSDASSVDWLEGTSTGHWQSIRLLEASELEAAVPIPAGFPAAHACGARAVEYTHVAQQPSVMEVNDFSGAPARVGVEQQQQQQQHWLQRQGSPSGEPQQNWSDASDGPWDELMDIIPEDEDFDLPGVAELPVQDAAAPQQQGSQQQHMEPQQQQVQVQEHSWQLPSLCKQSSLASSSAGAPASGMACPHLGAAQTATRWSAGEVEVNAVKRAPLFRDVGGAVAAARRAGGGALTPHSWPGSGFVQRRDQHAHERGARPAQLSVTPRLRPAAAPAIQPADNTVELMTRISLQLFGVMPDELPQGLHEALAYMLTTTDSRTNS
ncbi:hypothetical protein N2152v2_005356 [Parachlorella kessleri]